MKLDAEIKFNKDIKQFKANDELEVMVDEDYCADFDDVIQWVENTLWDKFGVNAAFNVDFTIINQGEICSELDKA